ncbi:MAG: asparagine synthase (glutamine-hydrolyzing) [Saprospirales bacterium]|nr:MAG: asparagine synthase (glutamine-hydrolyzing) [Saprospirales bacterium]
MCGIAGLINANLSAESLDKVVSRLQIALQHRGPDDQGKFIASDLQVALVHTRLSILDLSSAGHQPMTSSDGRYWISFNGEIYNFRQLRSELEGVGEKFSSQTDTEVILRLYQREGACCVKKLRGMFAFAIWDDWEKTCFLARDPLGIKPLYYWRSGSTVVFASELRAVLASGLPSIALDEQGLYSYLTMGSVTEPLTLIAGVSLLEAGHTLLWKKGDLHQSQYWQIHFSSKPHSDSEAIEKVRAALIESVQHHFVSDVPVGVFLSGGIDSTSVVALSRQIQSGSLNTYSIAFSEPDWNEGFISHRVAEEFETNHTEYTITAATALPLLSQYLSALDQPSVDGFNTFCVSKLAHDDGMKVVLSGLGGDEIFGGYPSFQQVPNMVRLAQRTKAIFPITQLFAFGLERLSPKIQLRRLANFLYDPSSFNAYRSIRGIFSHWEAIQIMRRYCSEAKLFSIDKNEPGSGSNNFTLEDIVSYFELNYYMKNQLLRDSDVMSMFWGLELRVPLVDRDLLDTISSIPSSMRLVSGKKLLVDAVPELPTWIINRPKKGFSFPYEKWMNTTWKGRFPEGVNLSGVPLNTWYRQWSLGVFENWWEKISDSNL